MKFNGAQLVVRALREEGIHHGFGIPGTHNIELYDAMADESSFQPVLVTDEQSASFMADGYARASGGLAVVNVVPGAGLTHAMSGIAEAFMDCVPLLVLACGIRKDTTTAFQLHDIDQVSIAKPVCKKVFQPRTHVELYHAIREACHWARLAPAGPVLVEVPANLYLFNEDIAEHELNFHFSESRLTVDQSQIEKIAWLINDAQNVGLYVGAGAQQASQTLVELAEYIDAIVFTTISGKGVFPEDHPRFAWNTMGPAAPKGIRKLESDLDCLIAVGCRFGEVATASYGVEPPKNLIHIDIDSNVFNKNYPAHLVLQADARDALSALLASPALKRKPTKTARLVSLAHAHDEVRREQALAPVLPEKVSPYQLMRSMQDKFGENTVYVTDSGNGTFLAMEQLSLTKPRSFLGPIDYSCMGYSVPAAIGAKMACPERAVVAFVGDGAFLMTGMEMLTAVNYGVGCVFCILRDGELSQIAQFQRVSLNRETCTTLFQLDFQHLSKALGIDYVRVNRNQELENALDQVQSITNQKRPVLLEVNIDYSNATYFSKGVVKTNFLRFPWKDRVRLIGRVVKRKIF